jgi:hypothetical protein
MRKNFKALILLVTLSFVVFASSLQAQPPLGCVGGWTCYWVEYVYYECDCLCHTNAQCWTYDGEQWYCNFDVQEWMP